MTTLPRHALVVHEQAGAGGFGHPSGRDPKLIQQDLAEEKISPGYAERYHGVGAVSGNRDGAPMAPAPTAYSKTGPAE